MSQIRGILGRTEPYPSLSQISQILNTILTQLGQKSAVGHTHNISEINNLQSTLDDIVSGGGGLTAYEHTQGSAATTWTINHNKGYNPQIQAFTVGGLELIGDVLHTTVNQTTITFVDAQAGTARLL